MNTSRSAEKNYVLGENMEKPTPVKTEKAQNGAYPVSVYENCYFSDSLRAGRSGIESRCGGGDLPHLSRPALGPTQPPIQCYRVSFPAGA